MVYYSDRNTTGVDDGNTCRTEWPYSAYLQLLSADNTGYNDVETAVRAGSLVGSAINLCDIDNISIAGNQAGRKALQAGISDVRQTSNCPRDMEMVAPGLRIIRVLVSHTAG